MSKGLWELKEVSTEGRDTYLVPYKKVRDISHNFCCDNSLCRNMFGTEYGCIDYECQKGDVYCNSDIDCEPTGGILQDTNCYRKDSKFFTYEAKCVDNACKQAEEHEVACCPSYCEAYGKVCNPKIGCMDVYPTPQPCPPDMCCSKDNTANYIEKSCTGDDICCNPIAGVGQCMTEAECKGGDILCNPIWSILGVTIIPNLSWKCLFGDISFSSPLRIGLSIVAFIIALTYSLKLLPFKPKQKTMKIIFSIIIALISAILTYFYFWVLAIMLLLGIIGYLALRIWLA